MKNNLLLVCKILPVIVVSLTLTGAIVFAWQEATCDPPLCNVSAPVNVSGTGQTKAYVDATHKGWLGVAADDYDRLYGLTVGYDGNKIGIKVRGNSYLQGATSDSSGAALWVVNDSFANLFYVRNDGNVGIGTTSPGAKLDVVTGNNSGGIRQTASGVVISTWADSARGGALGTISNNDLFFYTNSSGAQMTLQKGTGNVGIGITPPDYKLDVSGTARISGSTTLTALSGTDERMVIVSPTGVLSTKAIPGGTGGPVTGSGSVNRVAKFTAAQMIGDSQIFDNGTNVGIGVPAPSQKLAVAGGDVSINGDLVIGANVNPSYALDVRASTSNVADFWATSGTGADVYIGSASYSGAGFSWNNPNLEIKNYETSLGDIVFKVNGGANTVFTIKGTGNVGIGTTSPNARLDVKSGNDNIAFFNNGDNRMAIQSYIDGHWSDRATYAPSETRLLLQPDGGNVGIGTTGPSHKLEVLGSALAKDAVMWVRNTNPANLGNDPWAIYGETDNASAMGIGVYGKGGSAGVYGLANRNGPWKSGVRGLAYSNNSVGINWGVRGEAYGGATNYGVYGSANAAGGVNYGVYASGSNFDIYAATSGGKSYFAGNVGIGTTTPSIKLAVGDSDTGLGWTGDGQLNIYSNNENAISVRNRNVGIGTPGPIQTLDVQGRINVSNGVIQRGGSAINITSDLGLYSRVAGNWIRFVTNGGQFVWFVDDGIGADQKMRLQTNGDLYIDGSYHCNGADIAELAPAEEPISAGEVVSLSSEKEGKLRRSQKAYEREVAGVVSTNPGMLLGDTVETPKGRELIEVDGVKLALAGRVPVKVTAENGLIEVGDLLVTSSKPGYAMKGDIEKIKEMPGVVLGKAMESLKENEGTIMVLVNLQ